MTEVENYKRLQWTIIVAALIALAAVGIGLAGAVRQASDLHAQSQRNATALAALCAQRGDLDQRIRGEAGLLKSHRSKLVFGIPRRLIVSSYKRDQTTRRNLSILECKE